jgi:hypothetical protein
MVNPIYVDPKIIDALRSRKHDIEGVKQLYEAVQKTMLHCDYCTTTTERLAAEMRLQGKVTFVLPNGFDDGTLRSSRAAVREGQPRSGHDPVRIGYAAGTHTHQKDFKVAAPAIAAVLRKYPQTVLSLFRRLDGLELVDLKEFPDFSGLEGQIEWRDFVPLDQLPSEMARFDISVAPLEVKNPFCEAKSELKYYEAALVDVPTVASPTEPFASNIDDGRTGLLANSTGQWFESLEALVLNSDLRCAIARSAFREVIWQYGPRRRSEMVDLILQQVVGSPREVARAFELSAKRGASPKPTIPLPSAKTIWSHDAGETAEVTIIIPLFNYQIFITDALESVKAQSLEKIDLVVVDDKSTDSSASVALAWLKSNTQRFNRVVLMQNEKNSGLGQSRNVGFDVAETKFVMALDADNLLLPECCSVLLENIKHTGAAFAYSKIQQFGLSHAMMGDFPFAPQRYVFSNYIDAMALVAKDAWAACGGYNANRMGWEDYELWCKFVAFGFWGTQVPSVLGNYRVHGKSMRDTNTDLSENQLALRKFMNKQHSWLRMLEQRRSSSRSYEVEWTF